MSSSNLQHYVVICDKKKKKKFIELIASYDGVCIQATYARGSATAGTFAQALGFEAEEHKVVLSAIIPTEQAEKLTKVLLTEYDFQHTNTGIAFGIPIQGLVI